eukprot:Em0013g106a
MSVAAQKLSRDDWKKKKELEEARKAGTAPAEVDEEGRDINPHIPQYIAQAPWYVSLGRPSLKHQRPQKEEVEYASTEEWYKRGTSDKVAHKFKKGACENCGATTHKKKDCLERPRKIGAKFTGEDIRPDDYTQPDLLLNYEAKRDRWNGYDTSAHQAIVEEYNKVEMAKRQLKAERLQNELLSGKLSEETVKKALEESEDSDDEEKYADQADMPGTKFDSKTRTTVRNLRIREDTAKYLLNLDPNSAFYDPKTRAMRENPFKNANKAPEEVQFAGENFTKHTGDVKDFARTQMFAWEAFEHGADLHPQADPTKLELMKKEFEDKKSSFKGEIQQGILQKYGGEEHLDAPPKELLLAQTEHYVEYSRTGNVVRGQEKAVAKSKYEEDVYINNHTSVWGSYWEYGQWGYACCHSLIKRSFCTGEAGKLARMSGQATSYVPEAEEPQEMPQTLLEQHQSKLAKKSKKELKKEAETKAREEEEGREERVRKAMREQDEREKMVDTLMTIEERKRPYNSLKADNTKQPTEDEMDAFMRKRKRADDPMNSFVGDI